jgi:hypothetical protein
VLAYSKLPFSYTYSVNLPPEIIPNGRPSGGANKVTFVLLISVLYILKIVVIAVCKSLYGP